MRLAKFSEALEKAVQSASSLQEALAAVAAFAGTFFACDKVYIAYQHGNDLVRGEWGAVSVLPKNLETIFEIKNSLLVFAGTEYNNPIFISDLDRISPSSNLVETLRQAGSRSFALVPFTFTNEVKGWIECYHKRESHIWRREEQTLLSVLAVRIPIIMKDKPSALRTGLLLSSKASAEQVPPPMPGEVYLEKLSEIQREYKRLLDYGNFVLFKTNPDFVITDVRGDTERLLGLKPSEVMEDADLWTRLLSTKERLLFVQKIRQARKKKTELYDELKIKHCKSGEDRWILFRGVQLFSASNQLLGWEAIGLDITDKKNAEEDLRDEKRRLQALYEVSHTAQFAADPEIIALCTLRTLKQATNSSVGFVVFFNSTTGLFELVAAEGFVEQDLDRLADFANSHSKFKAALDLRSGALIHDLQKENGSQIPANLNLRGAILMPLVSEGLVNGICFFARRGGKPYSHEDYSIVQIASSQIAQRIKQAQFHIDERKAADSLGVLYRLSHELSKCQTPHEVSDHAVRVISEELPCKRLWLGVMNEQRTHIAGHAGYGPGIRRQIVQIQVELDLRHQFFDEVIETKKPVVVQAGQKMDCSGLEKLLAKLALQAFAIVPLVSLGQVIGVLVVEPSNPNVFFVEGKLPLLMNIANEIGTVLLGRRFEAKVADTEKMKMAGLLASGVSHNFNNLLQTVMGHASLIQMQAAQGSQIADSARRIVEASGKGAALVNQLMTVSSRNVFSRKNISVNKIIKESRDFYKSVLGPEIALEMDLEDGIPNVLADYSQIQQAMTNILLNAKEALEGRHDGYVKLQTRRVRISSGEISADLPPGLYLRIDIQDNGLGMSEEVQSRCFEPFFTTKGRDPESGVGLGGSGLGLSSVYSILRQHAGYVTIRSQEQTGSIFTLFLPLLHPALEQDELIQEEAVSRKQSDVHLYSSDEVVISAVRLSLGAYGLVSYVSSNSTDLRDELTGKNKFEGLLIVDLDDPELRLNKLADSRRRMSKNLRCIFIAKEPSLWEKFIQKFPHAEFVKKPLGAWSLHPVLSRLLPLQGKTLLSKEIEKTSDKLPSKNKKKSTRARKKNNSLPSKSQKEFL